MVGILLFVSKRVSFNFWFFFFKRVQSLEQMQAIELHSFGGKLPES